MDGRLRLGLELPGLGSGSFSEPGLASVLDVARFAEDGGVGSLWLAEGDRFDPVPLLGAIAQGTSSIGLGVVVRPSRGRHPSVVARDVTAVDILSGGRAAVAVIEDGGSPLDLERVAEAASILHRLFTEEEVTVAGQFYEVAELTIRPRPVSPGGPPVVAGVVGGAIAPAERPESVLAGACVEAVATGGPASAVAECRARLDGAATADALPVLLWRGSIEGGAGRAALERGADGVMAVVDPSTRQGSQIDRSAVARVIKELAALAG